MQQLILTIFYKVAFYSLLVDLNSLASNSLDSAIKWL